MGPFYFFIHYRSNFESASHLLMFTRCFYIMETGITSLPGFTKGSSAQRTDLLILLQQDGKAGMNTNHPL
ncbi:hypothetical protein F2P79_009832 [Pimephales promelas]|nr:hypothetical protein F2P79_009832 [Pimephales promelas]